MVQVLVSRTLLVKPLQKVLAQVQLPKVQSHLATCLRLMVQSHLARLRLMAQSHLVSQSQVQIFLAIHSQVQKVLVPAQLVKAEIPKTHIPTSFIPEMEQLSMAA